MKRLPSVFCGMVMLLFLHPAESCGADFEKLVKQLARGTPQAEVSRASKELRSAGMAAFPVLIAHFKDTTPADASLGGDTTESPTMGKVCFEILQTQVEGARPKEMYDTYILTPQNTAEWLKKQDHDAQQLIQLAKSVMKKTGTPKDGSAGAKELVKGLAVTLESLQMQARREALFHLWDLRKERPDDAHLKMAEQFLHDDIIALEGQSNAGAYRFSGDYQGAKSIQEYLYVCDRVALVRTARLEGLAPHEEMKFYYELFRAHWGGEPEYVDQTGDLRDEKLIYAISQMVWLPDKKTLAGKGVLFTNHQTLEDEQAWFLLDLTTGKMETYKNGDALQKALLARGADPRECDLSPSEVAFRGMVIRQKEFLKKPGEKPKP